MKQFTLQDDAHHALCDIVLAKKYALEARRLNLTESRPGKDGFYGQYVEEVEEKLVEVNELLKALVA